MARIVKFPILRHLRSEASAHVLMHSHGRLVRSGRGISFLFLPHRSSIAELPADDREVQVLFHARTRDHQDVAVQVELTWRVAVAEKLADRIDFTIDPERGSWQREPIEQVNALLTGLARRQALSHVAARGVRELLDEGLEPLGERLHDRLPSASVLEEMGLALIDLRVLAVSPEPGLAEALQVPTREAVQRDADRATFERRAFAVQEERGIAENELQNRIELARREQQLIDQEGVNARRRVEERVEAERIELDALLVAEARQAEAGANQERLQAQVQAESVKLAGGARAERLRVEGLAKADTLRATGLARVDAEERLLELQGKLPPPLVFALAAKELAGNLKTIEHLNVTPDLLGSTLTDFLEAGRRKLSGNES